MASMTIQFGNASSVDHVVGDRSRDTFLNEDASVQLGVGKNMWRSPILIDKP